MPRTQTREEADIELEHEDLPSPREAADEFDDGPTIMRGLE